ncbi:hypothetical protein EV363DRAFT_1377809, partial [Boletus edulis]
MASALKSLELRSEDSSALTDSCGPSTIGFSSPTQSSPPTVIEPSPTSAKATPGLDGTSKITSSPTNRTCAEVSYITGVPPPTGISENSTKTTSPKTMGINMSQLRKLFIPKLDKNNKGSMSPTMQREIEILRAQKKVTGGEIAVDECEVVCGICLGFIFFSWCLQGARR